MKTYSIPKTTCHQINSTFLYKLSKGNRQLLRQPLILIEYHLLIQHRRLKFKNKTALSKIYTFMLHEKRK